VVLETFHLLAIPGIRVRHQSPGSAKLDKTIDFTHKKNVLTLDRLNNLLHLRFFLFRRPSPAAKASQIGASVNEH
jgi:hypothetical protein